MRTIISIVALTVISFAGSALAADADKGQEVFNANCGTCHAGGKNLMASGKSLTKEDLATNKMNSAAAIIDIVTNGKAPMPAFGKLGSINAADIENVSAYVLKQSEAGW